MRGMVGLGENPPDTAIGRVDSGNQENTVDEMWTAKDLETLLRIDRKTLYGYVQRGLIPYVRIQSNLRFPKTLIRQWIQRQSFVPKR